MRSAPPHSLRVFPNRFYAHRCMCPRPACNENRVDSRFAPSQRGTALLCNDVSHWLGESLESRGGGYSVRKQMGMCRWKLDPKRSREKWISDQKDRILLGLVVLVTPKDRFGVGRWEKVPPKRSCSIPRMSKRGQNGGTSISPNIEGIPSPGLESALHYWDQ